MKNSFLFVLIVLFFFSCSKKSGDDGQSFVQSPPVVITPVTSTATDTLGAGWTKIPVTPDKTITDVFFTDSNNGYLVSAVGVYKSINGGLTWTQVNSGSYENIAAWGNKAYFVARASQSGLRTIDGGATFQNAPATPDAVDVFYSSANNCYTAGATINRRSTDGGASFPVVYNFNDNPGYTSLFFLNDLNGWNIRGNKIYKTTDGAVTWTSAGTVSGPGMCVEFIDTNTGYCTTNTNVFKTINGGTLWQPIFTTPLTSFYNDLAFVSANEGYVCNANKIYKTTDSGATWVKVVALANTNLIELHFTDAGHGWATCFDGSILRYN